VTRERLYLDMMQSVLGNTSKVLVDQKGGGNSLLYLPLDQLLKQAQAPTGATVANSDTSRSAASAPPDAGVTADRGRELPRSRERGDSR
jgi:membrane protease subunit HflK